MQKLRVPTKSYNDLDVNVLIFGIFLGVIIARFDSFVRSMTRKTVNKIVEVLIPFLFSKIFVTPLYEIKFSKVWVKLGYLSYNTNELSNSREFVLQ